MCFFRTLLILSNVLFLLTTGVFAQANDWPGALLEAPVILASGPDPMPANTNADDQGSISRSSADDFSWTIDNGTLIISGTGDI